VLWKPIVWSDADHYPQWLPYPTRVGEPPRQGSQVRLEEHPKRTFVATTVEAGADSVIVWLRPLRDLDSLSSDSVQQRAQPLLGLVYLDSNRGGR
jgi:hypothetical protein